VGKIQMKKMGSIRMKLTKVLREFLKQIEVHKDVTYFILSGLTFRLTYWREELRRRRLCAWVAGMI
jgi:hypothetical protein